jgi:hypothetical protein
MSEGEREALLDAAERVQADEQSLRQLELSLREVAQIKPELARQLASTLGEILKRLGPEYGQLWSKIADGQGDR